MNEKDNRSEVASDKEALPAAPLRLGDSWSYAGETNPANWGRRFPACNGNRQSPVNIVNAIPSLESGALRLLYRTSRLRVINDGYTIRIEFDSGSVLRVGDKKYDLMQMHFHTPSEHAVGGAASPMGMHLVHAERHTQELAVIGVFLREGLPQPVIQQVWDLIPFRQGETVERGSIDTYALLGLPDDTMERYYAYEGSLTTPPCTEGVRWFIGKTFVEISAGQIARFRQLFPHNARPLQSLNGRKILDFEPRVSRR